jgi:hypothetical protein
MLQLNPAVIMNIPPPVKAITTLAMLKVIPATMVISTPTVMVKALMITTQMMVITIPAVMVKALMITTQVMVTIIPPVMVKITRVITMCPVRLISSSISCYLLERLC